MCIYTLWVQKGTSIVLPITLADVDGFSKFFHCWMTTVISQGSVATRLRCGGQCDSELVANFLLNSAVEKFGKSVNICQSYGQKYRGPFLTHSVVTSQLSLAIRPCCACVCTGSSSVLVLSSLATRGTQLPGCTHPHVSTHLNRRLFTIHAQPHCDDDYDYD